MASAALAECIRTTGSTHACILPSLAATALAIPGVTERLAGLQTVVLTGEPLTADVAQLFVCALPQTRVLNSYGLTECTGDALVYVLRDPVPDPVPLGEPYPGAETSTRPTAGALELLVKGPGLADGLGEWLATGDAVVAAGTSYAFAGRLDRRVKLGGEWIDLDAVAAALGVPVVAEGSPLVLVARTAPQDLNNAMVFLLDHGAALEAEDEEEIDSSDEESTDASLQFRTHSYRI